MQDRCSSVVYNFTIESHNEVCVQGIYRIIDGIWGPVLASEGPSSPKGPFCSIQGPFAASKGPFVALKGPLWHLGALRKILRTQGF